MTNVNRLHSSQSNKPIYPPPLPTPRHITSISRSLNTHITHLRHTHTHKTLPSLSRPAARLASLPSLHQRSLACLSVHHVRARSTISNPRTLRLRGKRAFVEHAHTIRRLQCDARGGMIQLPVPSAHSRGSQRCGSVGSSSARCCIRCVSVSRRGGLGL